MPLIPGRSKLTGIAKFPVIIAMHSLQNIKVVPPPPANLST